MDHQYETHPCPSCEEEFDFTDIVDSNGLFSFKCPHCKVKIYEKKASTRISFFSIAFVGLLLFLTIQTKALLLPHLPFIEKWPSSLIMLTFLFPVFYWGMRHIGVYIIKNGEFYLKEK